RQILKHRLDHVIDAANRFTEIDTRPHPRNSTFVLAEVAQIGSNAGYQRVQVLHHRVTDGHFVTSKGEHLRDAVAHQSGANDRDLCLLMVQLSTSYRRAADKGAACDYPAV